MANFSSRSGLLLSDHTHKRRDNTVRAHLANRERFRKGLRAQHEAAFANRESNHPTVLWKRRLNGAEDFLARHGRLPGRGCDSTESSPNAWVAKQRRAYHRGELSASKIILMGSLPGWNLSPQRREWNERWRQRLIQLEAFISSTGRTPRWKNHASEQERVLGVWLHVQTQARGEGRLAWWREGALDDVIPGWHSRM